jgi:hypothetical protein
MVSGSLRVLQLLQPLKLVAESGVNTKNQNQSWFLVSVYIYIKQIMWITISYHQVIKDYSTMAPGVTKDSQNDGKM